MQANMQTHHQGGLGGILEGDLACSFSICLLPCPSLTVFLLSQPTESQELGVGKGGQMHESSCGDQEGSHAAMDSLGVGHKG